MKKLLYIAFKDFSNLHFGANAKVLSQCRAFESYDYHVDLIGRKDMDAVCIGVKGNLQLLQKNKISIKDRRFQNLMAKSNQMKAIEKYIKGKHYDACYIRYDFSDPGFIHMLKEIKKVCNHIALELPTYPYEGENSIGMLNKIKMGLDLHYRKQMKDSVDFIVTFYDGYKELFGIPVMVIPNGFDFTTMQLITEQLHTDAIHIIGVSSMREWHGYERMIEGLHQYYENQGKENFVLHLVGNGREYNKYKALVEQYNLEEHVIMEGAMHGEQLNVLYEKCAMGVDSLARHRSGIDVLSSLKSREYGAKGLPIINSCKIDIIEDDFPYMLKVPADETPIDMQSVAEFYGRCFKSGKTRQCVAEEIRQYIEAKSDMKATLQEVVKEFEK